MKQATVWRWVYRDPETGRIRTDGRMTEHEATHYPGAMRIPGSGPGPRPRAVDDVTDFEDTLAGAFLTEGEHGD